MILTVYFKLLLSYNLTCLTLLSDTIVPSPPLLRERKDLPKMGITSRCGVVVITTAQLHSTKPELRFCAGSNPARGVSEICDGEDL